MISTFINLFQNPTISFGKKMLYLFIYVFCVLFSLIIHEYAHGWIAFKCGDPTAKMMGRLTFNPLKHLDPIGMLCMLFMRIGWAKPVPINTRNFRNYRRDYLLVSFAGIAVNFLIFLVSTFFAVLIVLKASAYWSIYVYDLLYILGQMNLCLAVFNLLPVPPLDGFRLLDQLIFKGQLNLSQQAMSFIQIGFLIICISGLLNGMLSKVIGTIYTCVYNFYVGIL